MHQKQKYIWNNGMVGDSFSGLTDVDQDHINEHILLGKSLNSLVFSSSHDWDFLDMMRDHCDLG